MDSTASRRGLGDRFVNGVLLYLGADVVPIGPRRTAMPISALLRRRLDDEATTGLDDEVLLRAATRRATGPRC